MLKRVPFPRSRAMLLCISPFAAALALTLLMNAQAAEEQDWPNYGNDPGGMRYSQLKQIDTSNVEKLTVAWTFHTHDVSDGKADSRRSGLETTPIMVDGTLYISTAFNRIIALDPETGLQRWAYDPRIDRKWEAGDGLITRGVATWLDASRPAGSPCRRTIFEATIDARLVAVDAANGTPCPDFGITGPVSLRDVTRFRAGWYHVTSPPAVIDGLVVVGSGVDDNGRADMPSGVVRAFDARTGALAWSWEPIPPNSEDKKWFTGAANAWSIITVDPARHLVFVPTGSASPDYYGGLRLGDDKWANSVVALDAKSGKLSWGFQLVHHDLWDYDSASPPLLATLPHDGKTLPVVIQGNKTGFLYTLERETGKPVFPITEQPVPQTDIPGEVTSLTQPIPSAPPALAPQRVSSDQAWGTTPDERTACESAIRELRNEGIFTPPSLKGTLVVPGNIGGMTWSGYAYSPDQNVLIVNTNNLPSKVRLIARTDFENGPRPEHGEYTAQTGTPYGMFRRIFLSPKSGLPCTSPPWGMLSAVDMARGTIRWQVPLGAFTPAIPGTGTLNLGGPIVTAGGLAFIAGTFDSYFRAFEITTGKELWRTKLPAAGHATPMTYALRGRQYVVIAASGHAHIDEESQSDAIVAFSLPAK
ncbi:MAG TPA: pyrroloquinoline quinone-dependent dehydrogenase [Bryobacteraceae bacterium]|jgi:quinoprotein glucose dehydrogenase|nr:pyrroloquinoline quinone-dependent dehydrogenase [Bryobacteraceae bacterium]